MLENKEMLMAIAVALLAISELIALIPNEKVKSNSVLQLIINILKAITSKKKP